MIDARNTFRIVNRTINDFSPEQLEGLTTIIKSYRDEMVDFKYNSWLRNNFPNGKYKDVEGLCKIASMEDIIENDYSLTPGRYVGFKIQINEEFDYKGRIEEIKEKLNELNNKSSELIKEIKAIKL